MDSNPGLWAPQSVPLTSCQLPPPRLTPRRSHLQREKWTHPSLPVTSPPLPPGPSSSISGIWSSVGFADFLALFKVLQQACLLSPCFKGVAADRPRGSQLGELEGSRHLIKHSRRWPSWKCKWHQACLHCHLHRRPS